MGQPTVEERLAAIESLIQNHVLHALRTLDAKVWGVIILLAGALLAILLK